MERTLQRDGTARGRILCASLLFMGLGHILYLRQYLKGVLFALVEGIVLISLPRIIGGIRNLITLGDPHPELPVMERDHSVFMLIDGVMLLAALFLFVLLYYISVRSALGEYKRYCDTGAFSSAGLSDHAFPVLGLAPMVVLVLFFVVVPLVFSACVAFTDYSSPHHIPPNNTVNWVGLDNFGELFGGNATWAGALGRVALWTLIWAAAATLTSYAGGTIMAVLLQESRLKLTPFFRSVFLLPYAVPSVVSMLVWQNLLNGSFGTVNRTLIALGFIGKDTVIPWLSDATLAKFTCVFINLWAGFPYFMLLVTGAMTAISPSVYEAAKMDGANRFQVFRSITLPQVLYQTTPLIIMSFTHNINNFGAIFFLTGGNPKVADSTVTSAKGTDIIITWVYNLTVNLQKYNFAAVLAVCIFVVLAPAAIFNFRRTKSFRESEF